MFGEQELIFFGLHHVLLVMKVRIYLTLLSCLLEKQRRTQSGK